MTYVYIQVYQETRRLSKYEDPDQTLQLASISSGLHPEQKHEYQSQRESRYVWLLGRYPKQIMKMERHFSGLQRWLQK